MDSNKQNNEKINTSKDLLIKDQITIYETILDESGIPKLITTTKEIKKTNNTTKVDIIIDKNKIPKLIKNIKNKNKSDIISDESLKLNSKDTENISLITTEGFDETNQKEKGYNSSKSLNNKEAKLIKGKNKKEIIDKNNLPQNSSKKKSRHQTSKEDLNNKWELIRESLTFPKNKKLKDLNETENILHSPEIELIETDESNDKSKIKYIKNLRKSRIRFEKEEFKNKIKLAPSSEEKAKIKLESKNKIKLGLENNSDNNIIELKDVNKYYFTSGRYERILKNINLKLEAGKFILILGPSGSGKTTLLNIISGLDYINSGNIIVSNHNLFYLDDNKRIKFRADNLSFVFQSYNLISTLTIEENVKIGSNLRNKNVEEIKIEEILENLGLTSQIKKYPYQLSGGQQQRVSIARALAKNPKILFADEPTGALDEERGKETIKLLMDINKKYGTTLVIVTHNPNLQDVADIIIKVKDGKIAKIIENNNKIKNIDDVKWG